MRFYELTLDIHDGAQQLIGRPSLNGEAVNLYTFMTASKVDMSAELIAPVLRPGEPRDVLWACHIEMVPAVTQAVAGLIDDVSPGACQWIPFAVEGEDPRLFMNVLDLETIGEQRREAVQPMVRADLVPRHAIFRSKDSVAFPFVTDHLKVALEQASFTGCRFVPV